MIALTSLIRWAWRKWWRLVWAASEYLKIPLPFAPVIFGWMIGCKGKRIK